MPVATSMPVGCHTSSGVQHPDIIANFNIAAARVQPWLNRFSSPKSNTTLSLLPGMANRHGLIAGATGTGKTVTLQTMAEGFSAIGVPVFMADVKGDLAGISQPGELTPKSRSASMQLKLDGP